MQGEKTVSSTRESWDPGILSMERAAEMGVSEHRESQAE